METYCENRKTMIEDDNTNQESLVKSIKKIRQQFELVR